mgnify:CR=1 FL=1
MAQSTGEIQVDLNYLRQHTADALIQHLIFYEDLCSRNLKTYTTYAKEAKMKHDVFSINALGYSTAVGIMSSLDQTPRYKYASMALSGMLALITGIQRFSGFAEKAENARLIAKGFDKIVRDINLTIMYVRSGAVTVDSRTFTKMIEEIQRNIATVSEQAIESPPESNTKSLEKALASSFNVTEPERPPTPIRNRIYDIIAENTNHDEEDPVAR